MGIHKIAAHRWPRVILFAIVLQAFAVSALLAKEIQSTLDDQKEVALTIYNQNLALIKDQRNIPLQNGVNRIAIREVSAQIRPETAILASLTKPGGLQLLEQNFDFDLLTPAKLLEKYVGKQVTVVKTHPTTGAETEEVATVLSANSGVVLRIGDRIETGIPGRIVFTEVPANLRDRPTLVTTLKSDNAAQNLMELSYLSGGLSWKADYVAKISADEKYLDLNGWVTLTNQSGASYKNARLQLVAGDVNRVRDQFDRAVRSRKFEVAEMAMSDAPMSEESLFEYHLYTLGRTTDIMQNQTKQVALMNASQIPVKKEFVLNGQSHYYYNRYAQIADKLKVGVYLEFRNQEKDNLGMPLPKGIVRVYKNDSQGSAQFIGEDRIDHTPKDEDIRLKLGDAFDVTAKKKQTDYEVENRTFGQYRHLSTSSYEIELHNAKDEDVIVKVLEPVPGDWEIKKSSHEHSKPNARTAEWNVAVPAEKRVTLKYTVVTRY